MIPVAVLTGFLGSGKTTLLGRLLKSPEFARTAVIINEFGEVGLDHDLIETSEESFIELQTGCLCCTIRGDLARTLTDILGRRDRGEVTAFERIVIETSGLADPAPILHALMSDAGLSERLALAGVVATVDAVNGLATLERQPESVKQVAVADRLVLTKTDLLAEAPGSRHGHRPEPVEGRPHTPPCRGSTGSPLGWQPPRALAECDASDGLAARLAALNPAATVLRASFGDIDPARLFDMGAGATGGSSSHVPAWLGLDTLADEPTHAHAHDRGGAHDAEISCFAVVREAPIRAVTLTLLLEALAEHCGGDLLRLKGIVNVAESADRPAVIHGVQHVFHPPTWLDRWPSTDHRTRLVFITRGIPRGWVEALLAAIEAEVEEVASIRLA
jgi:G3E family GTPase